jgi:hypothetical protein
MKAGHDAGWIWKVEPPQWGKSEAGIGLYPDFNQLGRAVQCPPMTTAVVVRMLVRTDASGPWFKTLRCGA